MYKLDCFQICSAWKLYVGKGALGYWGFQFCFGVQGVEEEEVKGKHI